MAERVQVGIFLTHQQPEGRDPVEALGEQLSLVRAARDGGLDSVFAGQHHRPETFSHIQPLPWLARLAAEAGGFGGPRTGPRTPADARDLLRPHPRTRTGTRPPHLARKYEVYADWGQDKVMPDGESFRADYTDLADDRFIVGSPQDCLDALLPWRDELGVNHFILRTEWAGMPVEDALASINLLADEVAPALRGS